MNPMQTWLLKDVYPHLCRELAAAEGEALRASEISRGAGERFRVADALANTLKETVHSLGWLLARNGVSWDVINAAKEAATTPPPPPPLCECAESEAPL